MKTKSAILVLVLAALIIGASVFILTPLDKDVNYEQDVHWEYGMESFRVHSKELNLPDNITIEQYIKDNFVDGEDAKMFDEEQIRIYDTIALDLGYIKALDQSDRWQRLPSISVAYGGKEIRFYTTNLIMPGETMAVGYYHIVSGWDEGSLKISDPMWFPVAEVGI